MVAARLSGKTVAGRRVFALKAGNDVIRLAVSNSTTTVLVHLCLVVRQE